MKIPSIGLEEWSQELKPYQKIIKTLVEKYGEDEAIEKWVTANGPKDMVQFGGDDQNTKPYLERLKKEINKFLCGHKEYEKERQESEKHGEKIKTFLVSGISAAVGTKLGIASTIIAPVVVITLSIVGKISLNAYCSVEE